MEDVINTYLSSTDEEKLRIITSLGNQRDEKALKILVALEEEEKDKKMRKEIRRVLFRLKTFGLKVEERKEKGPSVIRKVEEDRNLKAYFSTYDRELKRIVVLSTKSKKRSFFVANAIMGLKDGLIGIRLGEMEKDRYDIWLKDTKRKLEASKIIFLEISANYAYYLIDEASRKSGKYREEVDSLKSVVSRSSPKNEITKPSDLYSLLGEGEEISFERALTHPIFEALHFDWDGIDEDKKNYETIGESSILVPRYITEERKKEYLYGLTKTERLKPLKDDIRRVLEDYSYVLYMLGDKIYAKSILNLLRNDETFRDAIVHFLEKSILFKYQPGEHSYRILITPQEFLRSLHGKIRS
ncbi:MAG: hypothetical protein RMJ39_02110 [Deltaproteobacteria bacterium]|nr:hypothetical protein [Deltaproteobacteria bacterium]